MILRRYALGICVGAYALILAFLHALHLFPRPGLYDISRLIGAPRSCVEGSVINFPMTRWSQTRFLLEGRAFPQAAFHGRAVVTLAFPVSDLAPGDRVRVSGWLSAPRPATPRHSFDEQRYWETFQTYALMKVWSRESFEKIAPANRWSLAYWAWIFHCRFKDFWFKVLPPPEAALITGITMGTRGVLPAAIKNQCIRAGVYHILVVSGQNVALLVALGIGCLRLFHVPRRWTFWISTPLIVFYAYAVGADPPVMRASIMAVVVLATMAMGRDIPRYYPLFLALGWILWREPESIFGASFQLSFGATASLVAMLPFLQHRSIHRWPVVRWFVEAGAMCVVVHLGVWPLFIYYFHQLSLVGLLANWTLFPLSGFLMVLGLGMGAWGVFWPGGVPVYLIRVMEGSLKLTLRTIEWLSSGRWAAVSLSPPGGLTCLLYYAALFGILFVIRRRQRHAQTKPPL